MRNKLTFINNFRVDQQQYATKYNYDALLFLDYWITRELRIIQSYNKNTVGFFMQRKKNKQFHFYCRSQKLSSVNNFMKKNELAAVCTSDFFQTGSHRPAAKTDRPYSTSLPCFNQVYNTLHVILFDFFIACKVPCY